MKFRPLHDRVLVKRVEEEAKTAGGIIITDTAKEQVNPSQKDIVQISFTFRTSHFSWENVHKVVSVLNVFVQYCVVRSLTLEIKCFYQICQPHRFSDCISSRAFVVQTV